MKLMNVMLQFAMQYSYYPNTGMDFGLFWLPSQQNTFIQKTSIQSPLFEMP